MIQSKKKFRNSDLKFIRLINWFMLESLQSKINLKILNAVMKIQSLESSIQVDQQAHQKELYWLIKICLQTMLRWKKEDFNLQEMIFILAIFHCHMLLSFLFNVGSSSTVLQLVLFEVKFQTWQRILNF